MLFDQRASEVAVTGLERLVALALEVANDDLANDRLVVDDENLGHAPIVAYGVSQMAL
jgi:hypothetical protein